MGADSSQGRIVTGSPVGQVPFQANLELLRLFLSHREDIVESIEAILNAQRKPIPYLQDQSLLSRHFEDCFFARTAATAGQKRLRSQLEEAHWAAGFRPRQVQDLHNDLIHPAEMMTRAFYCWQQTRWPGRNGRMHYAHTLFNLYVLRWLQFLSMRLWDAVPDSSGQDEGPNSAAGRLAEIQALLDELWRSSPARKERSDQPAIVRDARWLIPLAQSLITDELAPYFEVARQVTETLPEADVLEIQKAQVRMLGGHLTSQIRYYSTKDGVPIDEHSVVLRTRTSNALDFALLVQGLVGLLKAYECALQSGDERMRLDMAGAIFQGISPDPELFLSRIDLLGAYSMIEHVFIAPEGKDTSKEAREGRVSYSPSGQRHVRLLQEYRARIDRLIDSLRDDFPRFRPVDGGYSPYGVIFGLPSHLVEHMALKALEHDAETRFSLEDVFLDDLFDSGGTSAAKLAWVNGWRKLPHISAEVQRLFEYPQQFAEDICGRIESELAGKRRGGALSSGDDSAPLGFAGESSRERHDSNAGARDASRTGRLYIVSKERIGRGSVVRAGNGDGPKIDLKEPDWNTSAIPELPARYFASSDSQIVAALKAEQYDRAQLLAWRQEGHFLVSYETAGGWIALRKELLTEVLGAGRDARIVGLPLAAAQVLRLMCTGLVIPENAADPASAPSSIEKA